MIPLRHYLGQQETLYRNERHYVLPRSYSPAGHCLHVRQEDIPVVSSQLYAESMGVIAADPPQIPLAARLQDSAVAACLDAVVLVLERFASVYKKLSYAFLISIHRTC